jgi:hypothetical protein
MELRPLSAFALVTIRGVVIGSDAYISLNLTYMRTFRKAQIQDGISMRELQIFIQINEITPNYKKHN